VSCRDKHRTLRWALPGLEAGRLSSQPMRSLASGVLGQAAHTAWAPVAALLITTALCLACLLGAGAASAFTRFPDGVSDQNLPSWTSESSNSYFATLFDSIWVADGHIRYARYVAQWDVISLGGEERSNFEDWLVDSASMGLISDVALTSFDGVYPSSSEYESHLREILSTAGALGHPIRYLEPWNEPNGQGKESAVASARFTNAAESACLDGYGCMVVAGDLQDGPGAKAYEEQYRRLLAVVPIIWGVHPYYSVEYEQEFYYTKLLEGLPERGSGDHVWFTEIDARQCTDYGGHLQEHGENGQAERARWLVDDLIARQKPEHVFYYHFLAKGYGQPGCSPLEPEDGALYVPSNDPNFPDRPRPAAAFVWGGVAAPPGYSSATGQNAALTAGIQPAASLLPLSRFYELPAG
jgi:hypothetical protein